MSFGEVSAAAAAGRGPGRDAPPGLLARLGFRQCVVELENAANDIGGRIGIGVFTQFLPAVDPRLPEIGRAEQPAPPWREVEEIRAARAGEDARVEVTSVRRPLRAVVIPRRAVAQLSIAILVEVTAQAHGVDVERHDLVGVQIDP